MTDNKTYASVMADLLMVRAKAIPNSDPFNPFDLMTDVEKQNFNHLKCAIGYNFYTQARKEKDVFQKVGKGRYCRVGGYAPMAVKRKGRMEISL